MRPYARTQRSGRPSSGGNDRGVSSSLGGERDAAALFADLVAGTSPDDLPASTMSTARLDLLDTIGVAVAGASALGVPEARALLLGWGGAELSSVWGTGRALPPHEAAFLNAMSGHALDYDDQHPGVLHTGVCVIPAAIALAEARGVTDLGTILCAIVLGTEVADRLATATTDGPGVTGWLLTPLCGYFGAAAAAAKVAGLDAVTTRHAIGLAYAQTSGNGQATLDGAIAKRMQPAFASRGGAFAAALAAEGLTGALDALEGPRGFFHVYHRDRYDRPKLRDDLGRTWLIERATYKPYPCCAWTHAALECGAALRGRGLTAADLVAVEVGVNEQAYRSTGTPLPRRYAPQTPVDAQFSIPYTFAAAFCTGGIGLSDFAQEAFGRTDVLSVARMVRVSVDPEIDASCGRDVTPARAVATLRDGRRVEVEVREPLGIGARALDRTTLLRKFEDCCAYAARDRAFTDGIAEVVLAGGSSAASRLFSLLRRPA